MATGLPDMLAETSKIIKINAPGFCPRRTEGIDEEDHCFGIARQLPDPNLRVIQCTSAVKNVSGFVLPAYGPGGSAKGEEHEACGGCTLKDGPFIDTDTLKVRLG